MASNKFDFKVAGMLAEVMRQAGTQLNERKIELDNKFKNLGDSFQDEKYDAYAEEMKAAGETNDEIVTALGDLAKALDAYAESLKPLLKPHN